MRENGAKRAVVRCIQRLSQPLDLALLNPGFPRDNPRDARYELMPYEADVWIDKGDDEVNPADDKVEIVKRASRAEVAPRQNSPPTTTPGPVPSPATE